METISFGHMIGYMFAWATVQTDKERISKYVRVALSNENYGHSDINQLQPWAAEFEATASLHDDYSLETELRKSLCTARNVFRRDRFARSTFIRDVTKKPRIHRSIFSKGRRRTRKA